MKNSNIKSLSTNASIRQSAGVNAPQRINAKELWYILGLIEADGSFSCYREGDFIRAEMAVTLECNDIKLLYWIRATLGFGQVKILKHSDTAKPTTNRLVARYIVRSKRLLKENFLTWYDLYPPLTINKLNRIKYVKDCLTQNEILSKDFSITKNEYLNRSFPLNLNVYFKDWIIGFIEGDGSFYFVNRGDKRIAEFNIAQKGEISLLNLIAQEMGLSLKNKVSVKESDACLLTAVSLSDIQAVINFMHGEDRIRLKGLKKVKFLSWISELRVLPRYKGLKIPLIY